MKVVKGLVVVLVVAVAIPASAAVLESRFLTGTDGWSAVTGTNAKVEWAPSGGVGGGGYLKVFDTGSGKATIAAPSSFLAEVKDYGQSNGGMFSFDYKVDSYGTNVVKGLDIDVILILPRAVAISLLGVNTDRIVLTVATVDPKNPVWTDWQTFDVPLTASAWGVSESKWSAILAASAGLQIAVEAVENSTTNKNNMDVVGIGGFRYEPKPAVEVPTTDPENPTVPIPEPLTLTLMSVGALALWRRRK